MLRLTLAAALAASVAAQVGIPVNVNWQQVLRPLRTRSTLQVVANPLLDRSWNTSTNMFAALKTLCNPAAKNLGPIRYVPWFPYPWQAIAELEPPSGAEKCAFWDGSNADWNGYSASHPMRLSCEGEGIINGIDVAYFGQSSGYCGNLTAGGCTAPGVPALLTGLCVGKVDCDIYVTDDFLTGGVDPCLGIDKTLAVRYTCSSPAPMHTYWDFTAADAMMEDFMVATGNLPDGTPGCDVTINFSTEPYWTFVNPERVGYPQDPLAEAGGPPGNVMVDSTGQQIGEYYGRLYAHYLKGGMTDEAGVFHPSPWKYNIANFEILNEMEHGLDPRTSYLTLYDAIVNGIINATGFTGGFAALALGGLLDADTFTFFANASNHNPPSTPVDWMTWHNYPSCGDNVNVSSCTSVFTSADQLLADMAPVVAARDAVAPHIKLAIDELGIFTSMYPIPDSYWNAAAAFWAYVWAGAAVLGADAIGASQLVGSPAFPGTEVGWQFPEVSMTDWVTGNGNARLWAVKLLAEHSEQGASLVNTTIPVIPPTPTNPFCGEIPNLSDLTLTCVNGVINNIQFASYGTVQGYCGNYSVGTCNAPNSTTIVQSYCLGKQTCTVPATTPIFGDPCFNTFKYLKVQATCSAPPGGYQVGGTMQPLAAQAWIMADGSRKVLLINKEGSPLPSVTVTGAAGGTMDVVDLTSGYAPARTVPVTADTFSLDTWAVAVLTMP